MKKLFRALVFVPLVAAGCATAQSPQPAAVTSAAALQAAAAPRAELIEKVDATFNDPRFENAFWGVVIESLDTGEVWYERNPGKMFMPASNQKILTTSASLMTLGPNWRFTTSLGTNGNVSGGILQGDLIVTADGDPTMYTRFFDDPRTPFRGLAAKLKDQGITTINGDVIGNDDLFEDTHYDPVWSLSWMSAYYAAEYGALTLNENYVDLRVVPPATADGEVRIEPNLPSSYYTIVNEVSVEEGGRSSVSARREQGTNVIVVSGRVAAGSSPTELSCTITNPTQWYVTVLKEVLEEQGIMVAGNPVDIDDIAEDDKPEVVRTLATHESPPLAEILKGLMKRSQNMYAETMVRVLGYVDFGHGSKTTGRRVIEARLRELGVEPSQYNYSDGSGLSRYNYVSPRAVTEILKGMRQHEHWETWHDLMPIAGVDGTLRSRMQGTPAANNVRAKTGTIANVRGLSGYVTTAGGENLVFSFLVNSHTTTTGATNDVTDGVLALLAAYDQAPVKTAE